MGRFGQIVNRMLTGLGHRTVVLDSNLATVERMRALGIPAFYGDVARPEMLLAAGIAEAKAIVIALDDPARAVEMARLIRLRWPEVRIIARARDRHHVYELYAAGVPDSVARQVFDSAVRTGKYALGTLGHGPEQVEDIAEEFVRQDRRMLEELAVLWRPDVPVEDNPAYLAKAREQAASSRPPSAAAPPAARPPPGHEAEDGPPAQG